MVGVCENTVDCYYKFLSMRALGRETNMAGLWRETKLIRLSQFDTPIYLSSEKGWYKNGYWGV